jgi:uncharacterized protein YodC (DUF2158 family)
MKFNTGDIVTLKSKSPKLTVLYSIDDKVRVTWLNLLNEIERMTVHSECLRLITRLTVNR